LNIKKGPLSRASLKNQMHKNRRLALTRKPPPAGKHSQGFIKQFLFHDDLFYKKIFSFNGIDIQKSPYKCKKNIDL